MKKIIDKILAYIIIGFMALAFLALIGLFYWLDKVRFVF